MRRERTLCMCDLAFLY
uniref:Uncharacterized protein n=1 Tax=Anguilla anguilla TaxID=7936 RepID=A0A0E9TRA3_ANGAN